MVGVLLVIVRTEISAVGGVEEVEEEAEVEAAGVAGEVETSSKTTIVLGTATREKASRKRVMTRRHRPVRST